MTPEELKKIMELVATVYEQNGKKLKTAVLYTEDKTEIIIDNREEEDMN
jgi:hypothetical protein